jgi:hypothetical protein
LASMNGMVGVARYHEDFFCLLSCPLFLGFLGLSVAGVGLSDYLSVCLSVSLGFRQAYGVETDRRMGGWWMRMDGQTDREMSF